jgi:hypothetical protein
MKSPHAHDDIAPLDHRSSRAICDAVGERLAQMLRPESTNTSSHLRDLVDELQRRDETSGLKSRS